MEEKRRDAAPSAADSPASEPASSRRRAGANKRKSGALSASGSSSTPSKRAARDKASPLHLPSLHNGPLTRARQTPAASSSSAASAPGAVKHSERAALAHPSAADSAALAEQLKRESEWETLEAAIEAQFEAIRSRGANAHVVPTHCGWFSWSHIHPIEERMLPSFFNGKTENRTPNVYMEIRNWIMNKFHSNPNVQIELKDMSELNVGDLDARQEVMEFLDYWGLINYHPFPSMDSAVATASDDGEAEKNSLLEKLYHFETLQLCPPVQRSSQMTPATASGLFPESTIAEELVKQEGPAVEMLEYHCNSCSADCSRKRYHCQKQADFDLCTDCFSNRRFGSGMSSLDFILMEPAEVAGVNGGKWTDQETLLLLEALELYKENWNEIAEHVGTKSKAQCILHFVQMPIEDTFVDCDDEVDAGCKETVDPVATNNDSSMDKDASECIENDTSDGIKDHDKTSKAEDVEVKVNQEETPKLQGSDEKASKGTSKSEDAVEVKFDQVAGNDCAINALKEAFAAVGYSPGPEGPSSFAEVGNPVMALATFLAHLVGSDVAVASAHSSIKTMSRNSPGTELAARSCFLLEDPPDNKKEPTSSERDSKSEGDQDEVNVKQDKPMLDDKDIPNDHNNMKIESNALEDKGQPASTDDGASEKPISSKEQAMINHECGLDNCNDPNNAKLPNDQAPGTLHNSGSSTSKAEIPPSSNKDREGTLIEEPCHAVKDRHMSDSLPSEKKELHQSIKSNLPGEHPKPVETSKTAEMVSDSIPPAKSKPQNPESTNPVRESLETTDSVMDVDGVPNSLPSEKIDSQPLFTSKSSECNGTEKDADMMSPSNPVKSNSGAENGSNTGKDCADNGAKVEDDGTKTKQDSNFEKVKRAAISTLAAAAVKAKLLANQEEDQIRQLTSLLIEKQLHKLETKLAFFNDVDNVVVRAREHVERSRHKLYHERALIIASRLGIPASSSRGVPPSIPTNRIPTNIANSLPRPQIMMNPQRPLISRPTGTVATTLQNPFASSTAAGNSVRPSNQEKLSSVGTK
ncbi:SWI/SNF complex subunit SWI3D [Spatholobus suberectus]|nr:SWI/SNF complex subunit SWI3D [Spatholobus suberectus]